MNLPNQEAYYEEVWRVVRTVPSGKVVTYGQVAKMIPSPDNVSVEEYKVYGARWVGNAMRDCPADVPWQRVINSQGKISNRPGSGRQRHLLEAEGILFYKDKIDLKRYQWQQHGQGDDGSKQMELF